MWREIVVEGSAGRILHHHERYILFPSKIERAYDMPVAQVGKDACLGQEVLHLLVTRPNEIQQFERRAGLEVVMPAQVDTGIPALPQLADQSVITKMLLYQGGFPFSGRTY